MPPSCFQILNVQPCVTQRHLLHLGVTCFVGCLVKECKGKNHAIVMWPGLAVTEMLFLHFFMQARCV